MNADTVTIPSLGFARGAIVRRHGTGPNMLVARGLGVTTAVIVCEGEAGGTLRLREYPTSELRQVLDHGDSRSAPGAGAADPVEATYTRAAAFAVRARETGDKTRWRKFAAVAEAIEAAWPEAVQRVAERVR